MDEEAGPANVFGGKRAVDPAFTLLSQRAKQGWRNQSSASADDVTAGWGGPDI